MSVKVKFLNAFFAAVLLVTASALVALHTFGPNYRFTTGFWTDGSFDKANGKILGNLYVTGGDPSFHHEHAVMIALQLNNLGIHSVTGDLVVSPGFTMNFNWSARASGRAMYMLVLLRRVPDCCSRIDRANSPTCSRCCCAIRITSWRSALAIASVAGTQ